VTAPSFSDSSPPPPPRDLREAYRRGDLRAGERLALELAADPETRREARALLERVVRQDPGRVEALRTLCRLREALGEAAEARAIDSVLRLFDRGAERPAAQVLEGVATPRREALSWLLPRGAERLEEVFALAWAACPNLAGGDEAPPARVPGPALARAHAFATRMLHLPPMRILCGDDGVEAAPALVRPPAIRVGSALDPTSTEGLFRLGRALFATRPGVAIALATSLERGTAIHQALAVAFGPARPSVAVSSEAGEIVRALWALPLYTQRRLQSECAPGVLGTPDEWRLAMRKAAARAGLVVAGDASAALRVVAAERLRGFAISSPAALRAAVDASRDVADLVAFAVSAEYAAIRS
jgi:tetratricopeptide repeat protein